MSDRIIEFTKFLATHHIQTNVEVNALLGGTPGRNGGYHWSVTMSASFSGEFRQSFAQWWVTLGDHDSMLIDSMKDQSCFLLSEFTDIPSADQRVKAIQAISHYAGEAPPLRFVEALVGAQMAAVLSA